MAAHIRIFQRRAEDQTTVLNFHSDVNFDFFRTIDNHIAPGKMVGSFKGAQGGAVEIRHAVMKLQGQLTAFHVLIRSIEQANSYYDSAASLHVHRKILRITLILSQTASSGGPVVDRRHGGV